MFFNHKRFEVVDLNESSIIELNKEITLSFYIRDVFLSTAIDTVSYLVLKKTGRDEIPLGSYTQVEDITGDIIKFKYTLQDSTAQSITFRLKVIDTDEDTHLLNIDIFSVK